MAGPEPTPEEATRLDGLFAIAERLRADNIELAAIFEQTVPLLADGSRLELGLEKGFLFQKQLTAPASISALEAALRASWGESATLALVLDSTEAKPHLTLAAERARRRRARYEASVEEVRHNPRVQEAVRILGAEIKSVRVPEV